MKTTIGKVCTAYHALTRLLLQDIPLREGAALYHLRAALKADYDFACLEENKAMEACGVERVKDKLIYHKPEQRKAYHARIEEIAAAEVEIGADPVDISGLGDGVPVSLGALEGFVVF